MLNSSAEFEAEFGAKSGDGAADTEGERGDVVVPAFDGLGRSDDRSIRTDMSIGIRGESAAQCSCSGYFETAGIRTRRKLRCARNL